MEHGGRALTEVFAVNENVSGKRRKEQKSKRGKRKRKREKMRILANQKIKLLFIKMVFCTTAFLFIAAALLGWGASESFLGRQEILARAGMTGAALCVPGLGIVMLILCYRYFKEQDSIMGEAVARIQEFIAGDSGARIACDEEGELYRLFHEVNSLAAILNAKAENEGKSRKFLQNTISDISHQLKTPLAALNIYNGIMQTEAKTDDLQTIGKFTDLSEQELDRVGMLVQNLLKIAKFDAGSVVIEKNLENVAEMMTEVERHFSFRADKEKKEIVLCGEETVSFLCDRGWIEEAVGNLVKNALDHMEEGNTVWIAWKQSASAVSITVRDNGSGIHPEDLHHVFKRFYRSRFSKDTQGIGLGLPLAKSVVESHNGTIEVDSRLGDGTVFVMNFLTT